MSSPELSRHDAPKQRIISAAEMCLAILIVIAHNVFHWIPNEVPILFVLAIASFRIREGRWGSHIYRRPTSWPRTLLLSALCLALLQVKDAILQPLEHYFSTAPQHVSSVITQSRDLRHALPNLLFIWLFAAFGEEIVYRGYLLRRALDAFGPTKWGTALALLIASATFGLGHFYKGPAGMMESAGSGLILGGAYLFTRSLWASTLTHGLNDTLAIVFSYFGW
jgi:membrane protease YdiL (CAAX protease family)